jgi:diguanylate cyclase (GGDEF)-like protein
MSDDAIKVLLVDDNARDIELALMALQRAGVSVESRSASDAPGLETVLAGFEPEIALCDFTFPAFDGIEAFDIVQSAYPRTPVIFVSGTLSEERAAAALRCGAVDYVLKANLTRLPSALTHAVAEARERGRLERSLADAQAAVRHQAERLETLWRIANDVSVRGTDRIDAMLHEAAGALRPPLRFDASVVRIEPDALVVLSATWRPGDEPEFDLYPVGGRIPIELTAAVRLSRTQVWSVGDVARPPLALSFGWQSLIVTQFVAGDQRYALTLGTRSPATFEAVDAAYVEVLADSFADEITRSALETSLRAAESSVSRHVDRLAALWRIASDSALSGLARIDAMLEESAAAVRPGAAFRGFLCRIEGEVLVVLTVTAAGTDRDPGESRFPPGTRLPVAQTGASMRPGTRYWDEATTTAGMTPGTISLGWCSEIATRFTAGAFDYFLVFGSAVPTTFEAADVAYVEVLAESFASELARGELERALREAETRLRNHAQRLESLWRIANDPRLSGAHRIDAMLAESASAIRPQTRFRGVISRVVGDKLLVSYLTPGGDIDRDGAVRYPVGTLLPIVATVAGAAKRTRYWGDILEESDVPPTAVDLGWRSVITTRFETPDASYVLTYGSIEPDQFTVADVSYLEVLAASFANQLALEDSTRRTRLHAQRLTALWQIINSPNLRDDQLWLAMLRESAVSIRPGQPFHGRFVRIDRGEIVRQAIVSPPGYVPSAEEEILDAERRLELAGSIVELVLTSGGTKSWNDLLSEAPDTQGVRLRGWRSAIGTTFVAGGNTWVLLFASTEPLSEPFGPLEHAYIEILGSFFARHVHERWQFDRMAYQQSHDVLTGLYNRSKFRSLARSAIALAPRFAIVLVDVNSFREINEAYGHMIGDALLVEVGSALQARAAGEEIVGRVAGDVFGIYIPDPATPEYVAARARAFGEAFARGFSTGDREGTEFIALTASLGTAMAPYDGRTLDDILSHADAALFASKERGPSSVVAYVSGMEGDPQRRATLRNDLTAALGNDEFVLYFQPHVDSRDGSVTGCEVLIRWMHPTRGLLLPGHFIPFAEQTGIITGIDEWVMNSAFAAAELLGAVQPDFRLYFNLSGRQAGSAGIVRAFVKAARAGVRLRNLGVEITESDAMRDVGATRRVCRALRRLGVHVAIDDFGTGYSSLASLKHLPVDIIKIDRSFISGLGTDRADETIAEVIIDIATRFGFATLAEGVERQAEIDWLGERGCRLLQGFALSPPLPLAAFQAWLAAREAKKAP